MGAYVDSCVKLLVTCSLHLSDFEKFLGSKIVYVHGAYCPKSQIGICKASLAQPCHFGLPNSKSDQFHFSRTSGGALPLILCIHVRDLFIGGGFTFQKGL